MNQGSPSFRPSVPHPASHVYDHLVSFLFMASLEALAHRNTVIPLVEEKGFTRLAGSAVSSDKQREQGHPSHTGRGDVQVAFGEGNAIRVTELLMAFLAEKITGNVARTYIWRDGSSYVIDFAVGHSCGE